MFCVDITRDGEHVESVAEKTEVEARNAAFYRLMRLQGNSTDYAMQHGGWAIGAAYPVKLKMIQGTAYFPSWAAAEIYYQPYESGNISERVREKVRAGEIYIDKPPTKPGEVAHIDQKEKRFFVTIYERESEAERVRAYVGVDGVTYRLLIEPVAIEITRREGPTYRIDKTHKAKRWAECWGILRMEAATAPEGGGYDKHDFVVTFADGFTYRGRYDLKHWREDSCDLAAHCRQSLQWLARDDRAAALSGIDDVETARRLLQTHDFGQGRVLPPEGAAVEIVRNYQTNPLTSEEVKARYK
ncbi:MAG: hypothetical protein EA385_15110 [Salinarimonadaceae bacterium]|nr:MAG: hypothetical protein EA385_15110 [Salinarimonadaceae bacterium]